MIFDMYSRLQENSVMFIRTAILTGVWLLMHFALSYADGEVNINNVEVELGYRGVSSHGTPNRALEYDSLKASPTFGLNVTHSVPDSMLTTSVVYLNDEDYRAEVDYNHKALVRIRLLGERFYHNLDLIPYDQTTAVGARPDGQVLAPLISGPPGAADPATFLRVDYTDYNPGASYGLRLERYEAAVRGKLPHYPAHINLKYWRWAKTGHKQLRYVSESCTSCHMYSQTRSIDRTTEEFTAGVDAHLGYIDVAFEQIYRTFTDHEAIPLDDFESHFLRSPYPSGSAPYQHDADPDAKFMQSTIKANTSLGGGFVANASFSIGKRENESDLYDVAPVKAETDFKKFASDVTYTPSQQWTLNFRYRMLDMDSSNNSVIGGAGYQEWQSNGVLRTFEVRDSMDLDRDVYEGSVIFHPYTHLSLKGFYHREEIQRSNTNGPVEFDGRGATNNNQAIIDPYWELPSRETIQRFRLAADSRHLAKKALKFKAYWEYQTSDDPAYNTSLEDSHTVFLSATYRPGVLWGGISSFRLQESSNDKYPQSQFDNLGNIVYYDLDREQSQQNANVGFWLNPAPGLNLDVNYGYLRTRVTQDLLFGHQPDYTIENTDVEYVQTVQTLSAGATWQFLENLSCRLEGYHIRSKARYSPDFPSRTYVFSRGGGDYLVNATPDDLREISKIEIRQNGLKGRLTWQIDEEWAAGFEASFDDYDDLGNDIFDGSVQTYTANISRTW